MSEDDFSKLSLNEKQIAECLKKPVLSEALSKVMLDVGIDKADKAKGALLLALATSTIKLQNFDAAKRAYIATAIMDNRLQTSLQLEGLSCLLSSGSILK